MAHLIERAIRQTCGLVSRQMRTQRTSSFHGSRYVYAMAQKTAVRDRLGYCEKPCPVIGTASGLSPGHRFSRLRLRGWRLGLDGPERSVMPPTRSTEVHGHDRYAFERFARMPSRCHLPSRPWARDAPTHRPRLSRLSSSPSETA